MDDILRRLLHKHFNFKDVSLTRLEGYANQNYLVKTSGGQKFVLKVHNRSLEGDLFLLAENRILEKLISSNPGGYPEPINSWEGKQVVADHMLPGEVLRLYRWIEGDFLYQSDHTRDLIEKFGTFLAETDRCLLNHYEPLIGARRIDWDLQHLLDHTDRIGLIQNAKTRKTVHYFMLQFREEVFPRLLSLRKALIHNDANDWNVLVTGNLISGLIDFGDVVYAPLVQEIAVALPYILFDKNDPLSWAGHFLAGYHARIPLEAEELDVLFNLTAGRMCLSILMAAQSTQEQPDNDYLQVSQSQMETLLESWLTINPLKAADVFRKACSLNPVPVRGPDDVLQKRSAYISSCMSVSYRKPIHMVRAAFQYMYDAEGNTYLDAYNNIPHVGHQHPQVVEAGQRQMAMLNTNTRYLYEQLADYAEKLLSKFPDPLNKVFFVNSGSAASDLAIRISQTVTGNQKVMVLEHGYHGNTRLGITISHYKFGRKGDKDKHILLAPIPDTYRGRWTENDGSAGKAYAQDAIRLLNSSDQKIAAFIAEPIVGCAGQVPLAKDYLKVLYPEIRNRGGLCISDEVQTGFGRMGSTFWGYELQDVIPDIVVLGKPMGNGHPLAALVTTDEIAQAFDNGMEFFSSFGGNPVSCAIGSAVLDVIEEEGLQKNALSTGQYFLNALTEMMQKYKVIGDVRGHGLFIGIEFVKDRKTKKVHTVLANDLKNHLRDHHILVSTDGPFDNIIKMKPPLCFNRRNVDQVVEMMDLTLQGFRT